MCQFNQQIYFYGRAFMKKILLMCLLFSPCIFALEQDSTSVAGLIYQDKAGTVHSAPLLNSAVEMHINGLINRVKVTQTFVNTSDHWINANYLFPLPENAAVDHLRMVIGEREIIGEIQEKSVAQKTYNEAKQVGKKASLIEQQRNDMFNTAVANIAPQETVQIDLEYQQAVAYKSGVFSVYFPMTITPRYAPEIAPLNSAARKTYLNCLAEQQEITSCEENWNSWLQGIQAQQIAQKTITHIKGENDPDLQVNLHIYLNSSLAVSNITSPYHAINIVKTDASSNLITLQNGPVIADHDFALNWQVAATEQAESALFVEQKGEEKYGALMVIPPATQFTESARINKEVIFVIDVSGSMAGSSITQAKSALRFGIDQLAENDTFNIIAFSDQSEFFANNALPVDQRSKVMAKVFIEQLQASGGTNMEGALQASLVGQRTIYANKAQGLRQIVFITDASISNEQQLLTQINQQLGESRLFMVGIGSAPNRYFMKASATLGKGTYTNIGDINDVNRNMSVLFSQLSTPVLRDINLNWADGSEVDYWSKPAADLYQGAPLQLTFSIPQGKKIIHISGVRSVQNTTEPWSQDISLIQTENAPGVAVLWAKAQIDSLDLNRDLSASEKQQQITALGSAFHIVTKHTSLVAVEQKISRPSALDATDQQVKTHLPQGNAMRLPQTGLATELYKEIGLWLLLLAGLLWSIDLYYQQLKNND